MYKELFLGFCLVDMFSDHFHFHTVDYKDIKAKSTHQKKLGKIFNNSTSNSNTILVISNASIKNNIATSILHICNSLNIISKTIHYTMNIIFIKVKLFLIRCGINLAVQVLNIRQIIIITDVIPAARYIFDWSDHSSISIS